VRGPSATGGVSTGPQVISRETERRGGKPETQKPRDFCGENDNAGRSLSRRFLLTPLAALVRSASFSSPHDRLSSTLPESRARDSQRPPTPTPARTKKPEKA